ncbi:unnamed protein product [Boreogadus saida]
MSKEADLDVRGSECDRDSPEPRDQEETRPPSPHTTISTSASTSTTASTSKSNTSIGTSIPPSASTSGGGLGGVSIVSRGAEGSSEGSMQFGTRPPSAEQPGFMGSWQQQAATDNNLLFRMSQQRTAVCAP